MATERAKKPDEKFCTSCGEIIKLMAELCPHCGVRQLPTPGISLGGTDDAALPMILNGILGFFGFMGIGHMVAGSVGTGIFLLLSGWGLFWVAMIMAALLFGIGGVPFFIIYIIVWIWSILSVRSVVAQKKALRQSPQGFC